MTNLQSLFLGIIEGLTEFLPVSSTGHMVLASHFLGIDENDFTKAYEVIIQMGAILTVVCLYWRRFLPNWPFYRKIMVAFLPTGFIGFLIKHQVDLWLENPSLVAWALILGGVVLLAVERWRPGHEGRAIESLTNADCVKLGLFQSIAMVPGVSRSGATIVGGLTLGMSKSQAAEFSFFLAVPTMTVATAYKMFKMLKGGAHFEPQQWQALAIGFVTAFVVAGIAIKAFMGYVRHRSFAIFGYYRMVLGVIILVLLSQGTTL